MDESVRIEKLVHGGQGIGTLTDGRRVFVWNVLPGELVKIRITKQKHSLVEAVAEEIIEPSADRVAPKDDAYLSTSPWQIMNYEAENKHKQSILAETIQREHVQYDQPIVMHSAGSEWHYRNKMEYSFWADDFGLHLALFNRGTHGKRIVPGSSIAMPAVDEAANNVLAALNARGVRGSQLKTIVVRADQAGKTVAALFVKDQLFTEMPELATCANGVVVFYSNPKSPASVSTKELYKYGDITLTDTIDTTDITYDVLSFFQVNLPIFAAALAVIKATINGASFVDMYSGVGTIGLSIGGAGTLVELDKANCKMAKRNSYDTAAAVVEASAETALEYIDNDQILVVDPPRAGLHAKVTQRILEAQPPLLVYLSCNPITQARDLALLQDTYTIKSIEGYNFFPKTPHIESLAILELKK